MPLRSPTSSSRRMTRQALASAEVAGRERAHRDRHGLRAGIAAHGWRRSASAPRAPPSSESTLEQADHRRRPGAPCARLANSQGKRLLAMVQTESDSSSSRVDAAERLDVLFGLLLDDVDDVVEGDARRPGGRPRRPPARRRGCSARTGAPPPPGRRSRAPGGARRPSGPTIGTGRLVRSSRSSATAPRSCGVRDRRRRSRRSGPAGRRSRACSRCVWPTVQDGGTAMNSVCIRRPAESSGIVEGALRARRARRPAAARGFRPARPSAGLRGCRRRRRNRDRARPRRRSRAAAPRGFPRGPCRRPRSAR